MLAIIIVIIHGTPCAEKAFRDYPHELLHFVARDPTQTRGRPHWHFYPALANPEHEGQLIRAGEGAAGNQLMCWQDSSLEFLTTQSLTSRLCFRQNC